MNPNYTHTITVYNRLKAVDNPTGKDIWKRTVLNNCFYKCLMGRADPSEGAKGENAYIIHMVNTYTARIPESEKYKPYPTWSKLSSEEREKCFTFSTDDIVIYGECTEEITGKSPSTATELMSRYKPNAFRITVFSDNTHFICNRHYRIGG